MNAKFIGNGDIKLFGSIDAAEESAFTMGTSISDGVWADFVK
ncbi:MAG TPA: hypothetical protein PLT34_01775 [Muribaculaceae bacterium]|nr:hypothetical protein [Muribaculaceae bacterium]